MRLIQKLNSKDAVLNRIQDLLIEVLNPVLKKTIIDGDIVENVVLTSGQDNLINHKLGRSINGWIITKQDSNASIYLSSTENQIPTKQVILKTSATVTVNIYFF